MKNHPSALRATKFDVPHAIVPKRTDSPEVRLEKARDYMRLFSRVNRRFERLLRPVIEAQKVTQTQYLVLLWISNHPGISQRELGNHLDLDRNTISDVVRRVEKRGLLTREEHSSDRRAYALKVTPRGGQLVKTIRARANRLSLHTLSIMPADHMSAIAQWLTDMANLDAIP